MFDICNKSENLHGNNKQLLDAITTGKTWQNDTRKYLGENLLLGAFQIG